eukprot:4761200-Pleurochrysis_carterae.AAC.1
MSTWDRPAANAARAAKMASRTHAVVEMFLCARIGAVGTTAARRIAVRCPHELRPAWRVPRLASDVALALACATLPAAARVFRGGVVLVLRATSVSHGSTS